MVVPVVGVVVLCYCLMVEAGLKWYWVSVMILVRLMLFLVMFVWLMLFFWYVSVVDVVFLV